MSTPFGRANRDWTSALQKSRTEIERLQDAIAEACKGTPGAGKVSGAFAKLTGSLDQLDTALGTSFGQGLGARNEEAREKARATARDMARRAADILSRNKLFKDLDRNPFVEIGAVRRLSETLSSIDKDLAA